MTKVDTVTVADVEALRAPLTGYCYRLLGAAADTDDAVQETIIRASTRLGTFDPRRARLTTWVHRIATNICLDMLRAAARRALPVDLSPGSAGAAAFDAPLPAERFVEPMPDARLFEATDPGHVVERRETVRLAYIAALQHLTPRQRAVLVLRDVLGFSAAETAVVLQVSTAAANSALQRARARLAAAAPQPAEITDPADPAQQQLVQAFIDAFEGHDVESMIQVLHADAVQTMPPLAWQVVGGARIAQMICASEACARDRMLPITINGSIGVGQYRPDEAGALRPFALVLLESTGGQVIEMVTFLGTEGRFAEFCLPHTLEPSAAGR